MNQGCASARCLKRRFSEPFPRQRRKPVQLVQRDSGSMVQSSACKEVKVSAPSCPPGTRSNHIGLVWLE